MTTMTDAYLALLEQVESALVEALDTGKIPEDHHQHDDLVSMRHEVAAVRRAMQRRRAESDRTATMPPMMANS